MSERKLSFKSFLIKMTFRVIGIILIGAIVVILLYRNQTEVYSRDIKAELSVASELTTAKLEYSGYKLYSDEGIPFLTKANFLMVYDATVRAGIDVNDAEIEVDNDKNIIWLTIPKAEIQDIKVDLNSIKFYDEKFSLFNFNEKEDGVKAQALAEIEAKEKASKMGILELADKQSEAIIKGILEDAVPKNYTFKFR